MSQVKTLQNRWGLTQHAALHLACLLQAHPGLVVTSGRRSHVDNARVGGVPNSFHLTGRAVDVDGPTSLLTAARRTALAQRVSYNCTGPEEALHERKGRHGEHLHLAW